MLAGQVFQLIDEFAVTGQVPADHASSPYDPARASDGRQAGETTAIEEALTVAPLLNDLKVTGPALTKALGRSRTDLAHTVRLLELPDEVIGLVDRGTLSRGHGKAA